MVTLLWDGAGEEPSAMLEIFYILIWVELSWMYIYAKKSLNYIHLRLVQFMAINNVFQLKSIKKEKCHL